MFFCPFLIFADQLIAHVRRTRIDIASRGKKYQTRQLFSSQPRKAKTARKKQRTRELLDGLRQRLNDCSMKHYIVLNIALFSHAHVTISAEINLTHACSRSEASRSNCHSRLRAFVGKASWNWETVLKV